MADIGHNLTTVKEAIADGLKQVRSLKNERADVNADIQSVREKLNALGISKKAFDMALAYLDMDPDKREGFDIAYALVREVGGLPMQEDLFAAADRKAAETAEWEAAAPKPAAGPDAGEIHKVIQSQESEKTKGKKVLPSSTGAGTIN